MGKHVIYTKLAHHKGARRLWIQGARLEDVGLLPGVRYMVVPDTEGKVIELIASEEGDKRVSRKKQGERELPVIDLTNKALAEVFGEDVDRVHAVLTHGRIRVTVHPNDVAAADRKTQLRRRIARREPLRLGSLCHGGGIMDHALHRGLEAAGLKTELVFAIEKEPKYLEASLRNNPVWSKGSTSIEAGIEEVALTDIPKLDLLFAGLPCSGASQAGKAKNGNKFAEEHDAYGALFISYLSIVQRANPAALVLENVPGYQKELSMALIRRVLDTWGYAVHETVLDGYALGALEDRKRMCMVAVTKGMAFDWDRLRATRTREQAIGAILEDIAHDSPRWRSFDYLKEKEKRDLAAGKGFRRQLITPESTRVGTIGKGAAKCRSTEPFVVHPTNPELSRIFTPVEHARVKGAPEELVAGLSDTVAHEILGQSVVWPAFHAVGKLLGEALQASTPVAVAGSSTATPRYSQLDLLGAA